MQEIKQGIKLTCPICSHKWLYAGKNKIKATCPDCMRKISIVQSKTK